MIGDSIPSLPAHSHSYIEGRTSSVGIIKLDTSLQMMSAMATAPFIFFPNEIWMPALVAICMKNFLFLFFSNNYPPRRLMGDILFVGVIKLLIFVIKGFRLMVEEVVGELYTKELIRPT